MLLATQLFFDLGVKNFEDNCNATYPLDNMSG